MRDFLLRLASFGFAALILASGAIAKPEVIQRLDGFRKPQAARIGPRGDELFVLNQAMGERGAIRKESTISKLAIGANGAVSLSSHNFVSGLTAPVDMAFAPVSYGRVPEKFLFVLVGTPLVQDEKGKLIKDASDEFIGLIVVNPATGQIVAEIDIGPTSRTPLQRELSLLAPSSLAFDKDGNLYIGDMGIGGNMFPKAVKGSPAIWRIERRALADLVTGVLPKDVKIMKISSLPGPMFYEESDDVLFFTTNHTQGPPSGSVFKIGASEFKGLAGMQTIVRGLPAVSGMSISPQGRVLLATAEGELIYPRGKKNHSKIHFRPRKNFANPGMFDMMRIEGGILLMLPEQSSAAPGGKGQYLSVVKLDKGH